MNTLREHAELLKSCLSPEEIEIIKKGNTVELIQDMVIAMKSRRKTLSESELLQYFIAKGVTELDEMAEEIIHELKSIL